MTTRPRIGVTAHVELVTDTDGDALLHYVAAVPYVKALHRAGALAVVLPVVELSDVDELLASVDGLVVTGGCDVDPASYGETPHPKLGPIDPARDAADVAVCRAAVARDLPTLAVCRGVQVLNVAMGGSLVQHVDAHMRLDGYNQSVHTVQVDAASRLASIVGAGELGVNTLHHQVLDRLGTGVRPVAHNPDGHVEAIEIDHARNVLGVQWHPELLRHRSDHLALFADLVAAARG